MKKIIQYPILLFFGIFMLAFFVLDMAYPDREFSDLENQYLARRPEFSWKKLLANKYTLDYEEYINDQFVFRDSWLGIKSRAEFALGKIENNGIAYGDDHYMFTKLLSVDQQRVSNNLGFIQQYIDENPDEHITFSLIPNSYAILQNKVPLGLPNVVQQTEIASCMDRVSGDHLSKLDLFPVLSAHQDEYIYYRTDHHWTTQGAYWAYCAYVQSLGLTPVSQEELPQAQVAENFYGTNFSKSLLFNALPDTITYYDVPLESVTIDGEAVDGIYDKEKLNTRDKYAMFLRGNNGITRMISPDSQEKKDRILVIKDSYSNCFVPFLTYNFKEVVVVDLRALPMTMSELMASEEFDEVLILYNYSSFTSDTDIAKIKY